MRHKLLLCAFVLLISTPVAAQEFSPIVIDTGKPTPSVVKSGEPFKITYRVKFVDTVVISEEQMEPENIALDKVEVIGLKIEKEEPYLDDNLGIVNVWDFTYTFRIIQPQKGVYKIPSFNFVWVEKRAGVTVEEAKDKEKPREMPTDEVGVGYVSTVRPSDKPVTPPPLDIRDGINFVLPVASGTVLRRWAYGVIGIASFLAMIVVFVFAKYSKTRQVNEVNKEFGAETPENEVVADAEPILSPKQARKKFLKELKKLRAESRLDLTKKIRPLVRDLLLAEFPGTIRNSMSANEIFAKLSGFDANQKKQIGSKYSVMLDLALRLKSCQEDIDLEKYSSDAVNWKEVVELKEAVSGLKLHNIIWRFVKRLARMGR